jgi:hypothetical protein
MNTREQVGCLGGCLDWWVGECAWRSMIQLGVKTQTSSFQAQPQRAALRRPCAPITLKTLLNTHGSLQIRKLHSK